MKPWSCDRLGGRGLTVTRSSWIRTHALSGLLLAAIVSLAWFNRDRLHAVVEVQPALLVAAVVGAGAWTFVVALVLLISAKSRERLWRHRVEEKLPMGRVSRPGRFERWWSRLPDPLEWAASPILRTRFGRRLADDWRQAGLGSKGSRYLLVLIALMLAAGYLGQRAGGPILALALATTLPILPIRWVHGRAGEHAHRTGEQVPAAMDGIAAGLSAGLSFDRAVEFAADELPAPMGLALGRLHRLLEVGYPFEEAVQRWQHEYPLPGLSLAMDGVRLQRQLGGDMIRMLSETADLIRSRLELEREVRAVTAQGRLSGWVIGALVPVSATVLLTSNPRYIDVLFDSLIGQALLAVAIGLQLIGWWLISRLIQIDV